VLRWGDGELNACTNVFFFVWVEGAAARKMTLRTKATWRELRTCLDFAQGNDGRREPER
jgi:hypothetical protein